MVTPSGYVARQPLDSYSRSPLSEAYLPSPRSAVWCQHEWCDTRQQRAPRVQPRASFGSMAEKAWRVRQVAAPARFKPVASATTTALMATWWRSQRSSSAAGEPRSEAVVIRKKYNPFIPQAARYRSVDWLASLRGIPRSSLLRRISGPLLWTTLNAWFTYLIFLQLTLLGLPLPGIGVTVHSLLGSALGLLLVFRTNTAYSRFWEGRKIWEQILGLGRELTRNAVVFRRQMGLGPAARTIRYVQAFPFCMIEHLRGKANKASRAKLEVLMQQDSEFMSSEDQETLPRNSNLSISSNRPLYIVNNLAHTIAAIPNEEGPQALFTNRERVWLLGMVTKLSSSISACERLVQTPVPLSYVRHTSRFLSLFMLTLPWALVEHLGLLTVPAVCLTAWALFGILEIGLVIEDPFQGVLKLEVVANTLERDVLETVRFLGADDLLRLLSTPTSSNQEKAQATQKPESSEIPSSAPTTASEKSIANGTPQQEVKARVGELSSSAAPHELDPEDAADLAIFEFIDETTDGVLSKSELQRALQALDSSRWTEERVSQVIDIADSNSDGDVSFAEWQLLIKSARDLLQVSQMPSSKPLPADSQDDDVSDEEQEDDKGAPAEGEDEEPALDPQGELVAPEAEASDGVELAEVKNP